MQVPNILKNRWVQLTSVAVVAFAGGSTGGYILGQKKTKVVINHTPLVEPIPIAEYEALREQEADDLKPSIHNIPMKSVEQAVDEEEPRNKWVRALKTEVDDSGEPNVVNVFTTDDGDWDYEAELSTRTSNLPYILHQEEFINDEMGYRQETVTYYAGDDIMADPTDTPIYNFSAIMGELKFGHGSRDKNIVYIRNEPMGIEWEVLLHQGSFEQEVLGLEMQKDAEEDQLRHSTVQKFRQE